MPSSGASQSVWRTDSRFWPKAPREYVFLAGAFEKVGLALFGDEWTGNEALPPATPLADSTRRISRASLAIRPIGSTAHMSLDRQSRANTRIGLPPALSAEELEIARNRFNARLEAEQAEAKQMFARRDAAAAWIADKARNSELVTFGLWIGGGLPPWQLAASIWNRSNDWELFATCQVKTYAAPNLMAYDYFIFLTRESLDRALSAGAGMANAEREAEKWLRAQASSSNGQGLSRSDLQVQAIQTIGRRLSKRAFGRAWDRVASDYPQMKLPGRRSKLPKSPQ